jgi:hypothetical protein
MTVLPQPPAPPELSGPDADGWVQPQVLGPGQLSNGWRGVFLVGWGIVVLALAAVWRTSRTMGLSTWWLGASSNPQFVLVQVLPFVPPILMVVMASRGTRRLPWMGVVAALVLAAIGAGDIGRFDRLAIVELIIAVAAMFVSIASFAGLLQAADEAAETAVTATA